MKKSLRPWLALVGAFFLMFTTIGLGASGMTLFYKPVVADLAGNGFTQSNFSLYYTIATLAGMITFPVFGRIFTKHARRMRIIMLAAGLITLSTFVGYAFSDQLWQFYLLSLIRGLSSSALSSIPATMVINNWFAEKRGTVTSIAFMGSSFGGILYTKVSEYCMAAYSWRTAYWVVGVIGFLTVLIVLLVTTPTPEMAGMKPYGYREDSSGANNATPWGPTSGQVLKMPLFWVAGAAFFLGGLALMGTQQCFPTSMQEDFGLSASVAANAVSIHMVLICAGKLVMGWLYDRFDYKVGILYSSIMAVIGILLLLMPGMTPAMACVFAVCFGLGNMSSTVTSSAVTSGVFGLKDYGTIYGFISMFMTCGMSVAPVIASAIFDTTGTYRGAWYLFLGVMVVSAALLCFVVTRGRKNKELYA